MEKSKSIEILKQLSAEDLRKLLEEKDRQEKEEKINRRAAYEGIRADVVIKIENAVRRVTSDVKDLFNYVVSETEAFKEVMEEYGQMKRENQMSYTLQDENFKIEVRTNKVKKFDERADIAATRLMEFLQNWIKKSDKGSDDPMYQLAMTMLERNKYGDLDYKSISKLYELEEDFNNPEYSSIMTLFRESNIVEGTATNFYFSEKNGLGVWKKLEPSFNRL
jgi:hypothetical protein